MNIAQKFEDAVESWPKRIAIIDCDRKEYTFYELQNLVQQQANLYLLKGIKTGNRVLVFVPMSIELYIAVLALFKIGAVAVFLDEWVNKDRMELCCNLANCQGFIASFKVRFLGLLSKELRAINYWFGLPKKLIDSTLKLKLLYPANSDDTALITFTTGSTGTPKAANRTHGFLKAQFDALQPLTNSNTQYSAGPDMPMLPIVLLLNLGNGITSVIADFKAGKPKKFKPEKVWNQIKKHEVASITTSPYYVEKLVDFVPKTNVTLHRILIGGSAVFPHLIEKIKQKLPEAETILVYGSTEAEPISHIIGNEFLAYHQLNNPDKGLLVGKPDAKINLAIIPLNYEPTQLFKPLLNPNEVGEICVSGNHVLKGYINNIAAEIQNKIWVDNTCWHRTGDAGYLDELGNLFLLGRCQQIAIFNSQTYYPFLIEYYLQTLAGIRCGTILLKNEKLIFVIEPQASYNKKEIEKLINTKYPEANIRLINKMPMDPRHHSKIDYEKLFKLI